MFRTMRRFKQQVSDEICMEILRTEKRGAFSVNGEDGYPYTIPVDFYYDEGDGMIYIHGGKEGHKIDAIKKDDRVCFTTWNQGTHKEGDWAYYVTSVVAFGRAELVTDKERTIEMVRKLAEKYCPVKEEIDAEMNSAGSRVQLIAIHMDQMTGKEVHEK